MFFVAMKPDKTPLGVYPNMQAAQVAIADAEPDVIEQGKYKIHPITSPGDADALKIKLNIHYRLDKFEGGNLVETLEGEG